MTARILRLGSLTARLHAPPSLGGDIAYIFGTSLKPATHDLLAHLDAVITVSDSPDSGSASVPSLPPDGMAVRHGYPLSTIHTEALSVTIDHAAAPLQIRLTVRRADLAHFDLCVHLAVVLHKILFLLDRVVLHAAAVRIAGRVAIFIGDRGAGKTTTALALSRAGGTVLSEDHLILRRAGDGFLVSGCDERWRVDERTERHFFESPLPVEPSDYAGRMKKEVVVRPGVESLPYSDERPTQLFFLRAGSHFEVRPLARGVTVLRLMEAAGRLQRFVDADDRKRFLAMLSDFVPTITPWAMERSDNLADLEQLVDFMREGVVSAPA